MLKPLTPFRVERHGVPIDRYGLSAGSKLNVGITYGDSFREINACVAAKLDYSLWKAGGYGRDLMDEVLAWYDLNRLIEAHIEDAKSVEMRKQSRKGKRGKKGTV